MDSVGRATTRQAEFSACISKKPTAPTFSGTSILVETDLTGGEQIAIEKTPGFEAGRESHANTSPER